MNHLFLEHIHKKNNAKFMNFHEWNMPVQYSGILDEHLNVRNKCCLFDISHMGVFFLTGNDTYAYIQNLVPNNLNKINNNKGIYTHLLNEKAGVIDDLIFYQQDKNNFITIVNSANINKDFLWMNQQSKNYNVKISDKSSNYCLFALQGPESIFLNKIFNGITDLKFFEFKNFNGTFIFRTGYTGDYGFEILAPIEQSEDLFNKIIETSKKNSSDLKLAGLGARDSLRIEAGLPLYGNELNENVYLTQTNLMWTVDFNKNFIGKTELEKHINIDIKLSGFEMIDKGVPRTGNDIYSLDNNKIGYVTSGTYSPYLKKFIGICFISKNYNVENNILIYTGKKFKKAVITKLPFFKKRNR